MKFLWPQFLWLLLLLPLLPAVYFLLLRRRKKMMVRYASLGLVKQAVGSAPSWKRHVPPALFLLAIAAALLAAARPVTIMTMPSQEQTVILAMDVSVSMRATDVQPNRMTAAQKAAKAFIEDLPSHVRVGIVTFAGAAAVSQQPTTQREDLLEAIDRFQMQGGTAIGSGIIVSLATLYPDAGIDLAALTYATSGSSGLHNGASSGPAGLAPSPVPPGTNRSAAIILLTDGQQTAGMDMMEAARMAAERGVRIYTVGVGTPGGGEVSFDGWSMRVELDEASLKEVARMTEGAYFYAGTATELREVYESLTSKLVFEKKETEVSGLMALLAAAFALLSAGLSVFWFNRIL